MLFKRTQRDADASSKHWYQDKYQHVLVQRNIFALISILSLACALVAGVAVLHFAPLKSVEPYLLQIDEKTGITQKVDPVSRDQYGASEAVDRYFTSLYVRARENYNFSILRTNYNQVRLMSDARVFGRFRAQVEASNANSLVAALGALGQRNVTINSMSYIKNPPLPFGKKDPATPVKIMQIRLTTVDSLPNAPDVSQRWVATVDFQYSSLNLNEQEQLLNPIGYTVVGYQIQRELN